MTRGSRGIGVDDKGSKQKTRAVSAARVVSTTTEENRVQRQDPPSSTLPTLH
jgi:hypothetical protein